MVTFSQLLKKSLNTRIVGYEDIRRRIADRARLYFQNSLIKRGYDGTLKFDIAERKLEIIVSYVDHMLLIRVY